MKKIVVIGGAGYIGSALSIQLAEDGHEVTVIDPNITEIIHLGIMHVRQKFELCDIDLNQFDVVYHLADIAGIQKCEKLGYAEVTKRNVDLTRSVVRALSGNKKQTSLIYTSSSAIYAGASLYSISKLQSEYLMGNYSRSTCLRLGTVYGISPRMREGVLVNDMIKQAVTTGELSLWHGYTKRPYAHIDSCVDILSRLVAGLPGNEENIFGETMSKIHIARLIVKVTGCVLKRELSPWRFAQNFTVEGLDMMRRYSMENDIKEIVEYYEKQI